MNGCFKYTKTCSLLMNKKELKLRIKELEKYIQKIWMLLLKRNLYVNIYIMIFKNIYVI